MEKKDMLRWWFAILEAGWAMVVALAIGSAVVLLSEWFFGSAYTMFTGIIFGVIFGMVLLDFHSMMLIPEYGDYLFYSAIIFGLVFALVFGWALGILTALGIFFLCRVSALVENYLQKRENRE